MYRKFAFLLFFSFSLLCQAHEKPLLMFFLDGACESEQKIVHSEEFFKIIQGKMDFETLNCNGLSADEKKDIKHKYHLQEMPRLVLFDSFGSEIARYRFLGEKPETLATNIANTCVQIQDLEKAANRLNELNLPDALLEELYKNALSLKQEKSASLFLSKGVENNSLFFLLEKYRLLNQSGQNSKEIREKIVALDPYNEKEGLYSLALIDFQTLVTLHPSKEAIKPLEDYLTHFGENDAKNRWRIEMMIAQFYLNYDEWAKSLRHAELAFHQAPQDVKNDISKCCDYITRQLETHLAECTK